MGDFGFGSFGPDNEIVNMDVSTVTTNANNVSNIVTNIQPQPEPVPKIIAESISSPPAEPVPAAPTSSVSPARPPPGLSIGGMPPMPANAVLVHELENKLEMNSNPEP